MRFPADERSERKAARTRRGDACDYVAVRQVGGMPHRVHQHDPLEFLPRLFGAQYRQVGAQTGAGREAPQRCRIRQLGDAEKPVGAIEQPHRVVALERRETRRQRALRQDVEIELVRGAVGRVNERIGTAEHRLLRSWSRR